MLICLLLANSEVLFAVGNTAGIAVGLCVVAVWCFVRERMIWAGILFLAISLALKPHDSGLVWLFLLLAGGSMRKRSLQALAILVILAAPAVIWVSHVAPRWSQELRANLSSTSAHGDISDPGPASVSRRGSADVIIDLQTLVSLFKDDPEFYNPVVYGICGLMLAALLATTLRAHGSPEGRWYGFAAVSALSMLGTYHRPYDAKLLLLAVPACTMLWATGGLLGRIGVCLTTVAVLLTGDLSLAILSLLTKDLNPITMSLSQRFWTITITRPVPLVLLLLTVFYLWTYVKRAKVAQSNSLHLGERTAFSSTR